MNKSLSNEMFGQMGKTYHIDQVPEHFKELFIVSGYRHPRSTLTECIRSIFAATNETLNFWTHFLPSIYFSYQTYLYYLELDFTHDAYTFPLLTYMLTLCLFPFTSAIAHVFNTMSDKARHICFFLDYWALSQFSVGAAIAYNTYIFPECLMEGTFHSMFLHIAIINGVLSLVVSCQTRFLKNGMKKKLLRMGAYAIPYLYDSLPVFFRILWCEPHECKQRALGPHTYQFAFSFLASLFYVSHWPERAYPGRFDIIGHSHQIFHLCSALAPYLQMTGLLYDLKDRREYLLIHHNIPSVTANFMLMVLLATINIVILLYYIDKLNHVKPTDKRWFYLYGDKCKEEVDGCEDYNENKVVSKNQNENVFNDGCRSDNVPNFANHRSDSKQTHNYESVDSLYRNGSLTENVHKNGSHKGDEVVCNGEPVCNGYSKYISNGSIQTDERFIDNELSDGNLKHRQV